MSNNRNWFYWPLCLLLLAISCKEEKPQQAGKENENAPRVWNDSNAVIIRHAQLPLKAAPEADAKNLSVLKEGTPVMLTGTASMHKTTLTLGGTTYNEPWLLVQTKEGQEGWIHGLVLHQENIPLETALSRLLPPGLKDSVQSYQQYFQAATSAVDIAQLIQNAWMLRDTLVMVLKEENTMAELASSLEVLDDALPGFRPHYLEDQQEFYLFMDFKSLEQKVRASEGDCDDRLIRLYYKMYPIDSIEYHYPAWQLEARPGIAFSLLGKGIHKAFLEDLDEMADCEDVTGPLLDRLRGAIVNDITQPGVLYWNKRAEGIQELTEISESGLKGWSDKMRQSVTRRLDTLQQDSLMAKQIFNFRSGKTN